MDRTVGGVCALGVLLFKQKTAYEMRISDWSSDVCSSDLERQQRTQRRLIVGVGQRPGEEGDDACNDEREQQRDRAAAPHLTLAHYGKARNVARETEELGRASCRERVWQYV